MSVRAERVALRPINARLEGQAEPIVEVIDRADTCRSPAIVRIRATELSFLVDSDELHRKLGHWLDGDVIGHAEAPGLIKIRPGSVERAAKIIGRAVAILNAEFVVA